jgi:RNA polymerase sigma-70 factor (ECF subfamily)
MSKKQASQSAPKIDFQLKEADAFQIVYENSHLIVFRYIYGLHGGPIEDVEDLTTATFLRAWKSRRRFRGNQDAALGWLLKIARNLVIDDYRRKKRRGIFLDIEKQIIPDPDITPEEKVAQNEQILTLWTILQRLPNQPREMVVLRYILGWRVKDIAKHLDMNENTVSVNIRRILNQLQTEWPKR